MVLVDPGIPITKLFPSLDNDREVPVLDIVFPLCDQPAGVFTQPRVLNES